MTRNRDMMGMGNALFTTASSVGGGVDPERLRMLAKKASALFERGTPLTDAVVDVLQDEPGLNKEHVQRVTEFANTYAFERMFQKEAGDHRIINFDGGPADASEVMKELRSTDVAAVEKTAHVPAEVRPDEKFIPGIEGIRDAFFASMTKTASGEYGGEDYPWHNPHRELIEERERAKAVRDGLVSKIATLNVAYEDAFERMYKVARQLVLEGTSPAEIARIYTDRAPNHLFTKLALKRIAQRMEREDVPAVSTEKVASRRVVNPEHPICRTFDDFVKVAFDYYSHVSAAEKAGIEVEVRTNQVRRLQ